MSGLEASLQPSHEPVDWLEEQTAHEQYLLASNDVVPHPRFTTTPLDEKEALAEEVRDRLIIGLFAMGYTHEGLVTNFDEVQGRIDQAKSLLDDTQVPAKQLGELAMYVQFGEVFLNNTSLSINESN